MSNTDIVRYAVVCNRGLVREQNQDNFCCGDIFLECENTGLSETLSGKAGITSNPAFAVFDGLGGETDGDKAAWLAAKTFCSETRNRFEGNDAIRICEIFHRMNDDICDYALSNRVSHMGATAAALMFNEEMVSVCNLGDSRIYLYRSGELTGLSIDHVSKIKRAGKPYITQFLGIPKEEFQIEPYIAEIKKENGDIYLLCSDGLTDMLSDAEIESVISTSDGTVMTAERLLKEALSAGGKDNITIIVCHVVGEQEK